MVGRDKIQQNNKTKRILHDKSGVWSDYIAQQLFFVNLQSTHGAGQVVATNSNQSPEQTGENK